MNDSTPRETTSGEGEPTSFVEKTKNWYGKHRTAIHAACGAVGGVAAAMAVAVVVSRQAMEQNGTKDTGSAADSVEEDERRKPPVRHSVSGYTRRLADGREIPVSGYERGGSSEDEDEDEDPGEATA
ncbi:hypothetical protein [Streptomyces sp. NBC_01445]|uniref:hypothetical protein n=1 Tax=Streptomyces sp. NBC_01445 TaxID=2903869 RepID=UPI002DDC441B|nr:hypothetical protein [Streptomyces sp. NBC_01445]WSE03835.1 hypothetical protein OG574_10895 [Streptomyces sp. NBC_01445]